jgi:hypothetical protein
MFDKIKQLIFDRKRHDEEYKIVIRVLERMRLRDSPYLPLGNFKDQREFDYNDLNKIPDLYWQLKNEKESLQVQLNNQKKQEAVVSEVIDIIISNLETRYGINLSDGLNHENKS